MTHVQELTIASLYRYVFPPEFLNCARLKREELYPLVHKQDAHTFLLLQNAEVVGIASSSLDVQGRFWLDRYYVVEQLKRTKAAYRLLKSVVGEYEGFVYFYIEKENERHKDNFYISSELVSEGGNNFIFRRRFR